MVTSEVTQYIVYRNVTGRGPRYVVKRCHVRRSGITVEREAWGWANNDGELDRLRDELATRGLACTQPAVDDDKAIVEVWT